MKNALLAIVFASFGLFSLPVMAGNDLACRQNETHSFNEWIGMAEKYEQAREYDCAEELYLQELQRAQASKNLPDARNRLVSGEDIAAVGNGFLNQDISPSSVRLLCSDDDSHNNAGRDKDEPSDEIYAHAAVALAGLAHTRYLKLESELVADKAGTSKDLLANAYRILKLSDNLAKLAGNPALSARVNHYKGVVDYAMGNYAKSQMDFGQALKYASKSSGSNVNLLMTMISYAHLVNDKEYRKESFRRLYSSINPDDYEEIFRSYEGDFSKGRLKFLELLYSEVGALDKNAVKVELLIALGKVLAEFDGNDNNLLQAKAKEAFQQAYDMATSKSGEGLLDKKPVEAATIASQAAGHLAELFQAEGDYLTAIRWVDSAIFNAQRAHADYLLMRWETVQGDLLRASGYFAGALEAYGNAERIWDRVNGNVPFRSHDVHPSAVHLPDAIYRGQADAWLYIASVLSKGEAKQEWLRKVIGAMEKIKRSELEEFSGDVCDVQGKDYINLLDNVTDNTLGNEQIPENAVIFYPIVLSKRIEVLLVRRIDGKIEIEQTEPTPVDMKDVLSLAGKLDAEMRTVIENDSRRVEKAEECIEKYEEDAGLASHFPANIGGYTNSTGGYDTDAAEKNNAEDKKQRHNKVIKGALSKFYEWLFKKSESSIGLGNKVIETILYLPDTPLRRVPFAALRNDDCQGNQHCPYVISKYSVVTLPLVSMRRLATSSKKGKALITGLETPGKSGMGALLQENIEKPPICYTKYDAHYRDKALDCMIEAYKLDKVKSEIEKIKLLLGERCPLLLDDKFLRNDFLEKLKSGEYSKVHIASHGILGRHMDDSHLLAYDGKISLRDLREALGSDKLKASPIDLLSLSACETAKNNDYALLGFGSIATRSNVRSVVGTLYSVEDGASSTFSRNFYSNMRSESRLAAYTQAIRSMIDPSKGGKDLSSPHYWAPFVFVGHW